MPRNSKPTSSRIRSQLHALQTFPEKQRERVKAEKIAARNELTAARIERGELKTTARRVQAQGPPPTIVQIQAPVPPAPPLHPAHQPPPPAGFFAPVSQTAAPEYLIETRVDSTGRLTTTVLLDSNGEPRKARPAEPAKSDEKWVMVGPDGVAELWTAPVPESRTARGGYRFLTMTEYKRESKPDAEVAERSNDQRPPWLQRGELKPKDKTEWLAWQRRRGSVIEPQFEFAWRRGTGMDYYPVHPVVGFADPGGVVSAAVSREQSTGARVRVTGPWPK